MALQRKNSTSRFKRNIGFPDLNFENATYTYIQGLHTTTITKLTWDKCLRRFQTILLGLLIIFPVILMFPPSSYFKRFTTLKTWSCYWMRYRVVTNTSWLVNKFRNRNCNGIFVKAFMFCKNEKIIFSHFIT